MPLLTCIASPWGGERNVTRGARRGRRNAGCKCSLTEQVHVRRTSAKPLCIEIVQWTVQNLVAMATCMRKDAAMRCPPGGAAESDGDDSTSLVPRGQPGRRHGRPLAGAGGGGGRRGQRERAVVARTRPPGLDVLPACRPLHSRRGPAVGPR